MKKKFLTVMAALLLCLLAVCAAAEEAKPVILVVSFGTSYNDNRELTIGAVESDIAAAFPEYEVRRAFTAQTIIDKLAKRDGIQIDNVKEAMERLIADGVKRVVIQPTHVMNGFEFDDVKAEVLPYSGQFDSFQIGAPLLTSLEDNKALIEAVLAKNEAAGAEDTALVFMGHGTEHYANATYSQLERMMHAEGYENVFVGTVESFPTVDDVISELDAYGAKKVILRPLMVVAGDHANNDMAGDEEDSWKSVLTAAGYDVECVIEGLGQNPDVRALYVKHVQDAIAGGTR